MSLKCEIDSKDIINVFGWIEKAGTNTFKLWKRVIPILREQAGREFTDENPNQWKALKPGYLKWKAEKGYPLTIGVRKGYLKRAATSNAIIIETESTLEYKVNHSLAFEAENKDYFRKFHEKRPIFNHSKRYLSGTYRKAAEDWINGEAKK